MEREVKNVPKSAVNTAVDTGYAVRETRSTVTCASGRIGGEEYLERPRRFDLG